MSQRIAIVGNSGSGKSTFADWLGRQLELPVLHVDLLMWRQGWHARPESDWHAEELGFQQKNTSWIIDGVGTRETLDQRLKQASVIVLMDTPVEVCHENANKRAENPTHNQFVTSGLKYADVQELQHDTIETFEADWMPSLRLSAKMNGWVVYSHFLSAYEDSRWIKA